MIKTNDLKTVDRIMLDKIFATVGALDTQVASLILAGGRSKTIDGPVISKRYSKIDTSEYHGAKEEGVAFTGETGSNSKIVQSNLEIFHKKVSVSGSVASMGEEKTVKAEAIEDATVQLKVNAEKAMLVGEDKSDDGIRRMKGLFNYAEGDNVIDMQGKRVDLDDVRKAALILNKNGLSAGELVLVLNLFDYDNFITAAEDKVRMTKIDLGEGKAKVGLNIVSILTPYGEIKVMHSTNIEQGKAVLFNLRYIEVYTRRNRELNYQDTAYVADADEGRVLTEFGIITIPESVVAFSNVGELEKIEKVAATRAKTTKTKEATEDK